MTRWLTLLQVTAIAVSLAACTAPLTPTDWANDAEPPSIVWCRALYRDLDAAVRTAGVGDAQSARITGYPYLRVDRFLAAEAIKPDADSDDFEAWVELMRALDLEARGYELKNLPGDLKSRFGAGIEERLDACAAILSRADLSSTDARARLLEVVRVDDDYSVAKRVIGLYPFTSLPFIAGVRNLHGGIQADFSTSLESLPVAGRLTRYLPATKGMRLSAESVSRMLQSASRAPLGIPNLSPDDRRALFETFAPVYEIDTVSDDDRIGMPFWAADGRPSVDISRPVVFRRISYTLFEGQILVQLNYSVWFPARPSKGDFDLLAGRLDGITFRVTLGRDGRPLIYDSMHNCGCYHLFVPTTRLQQKPPPDGHEEWPLVPQRIDVVDGRLVLRIAHRTHYLQRLYFDDSASTGEIYAVHDDVALRSLPTAQGERRSLFEPDGLVSGTERAERWFFWPMGIAEPGAMRQWGNHATAFVGTRHFDDPGLIERYFFISGGG